jgi:hypothetical protein
MLASLQISPFPVSFAASFFPSPGSSCSSKEPKQQQSEHKSTTANTYTCKKISRLKSSTLPSLSEGCSLNHACSKLPQKTTTFSCLEHGQCFLTHQLEKEKVKSAKTCQIRLLFSSKEGIKALTRSRSQHRLDSRGNQKEFQTRPKK